MADELQTNDAVETPVEPTSMEEALKESEATDESAPDSDAGNEPEDILEVNPPEESDDSDEDKPQVERGKKNKKTAKARINELTFGKREAERIAEKARLEAEYWRKMANAGSPDGSSDVRPDPDNYANIAEYEDAVYSWRRNQEVKAEREELEKAHIQNITESFEEKAKRVRESHPDFDEIVQAPVFSPVMSRQIYENDSGPEIAYFLGLEQNHSLAKRIGQLPPDRQIAEIAKLEVLISESKPTKITKAPSPIKPIGNSAKTVVRNDDLSTADFMKKREKERLAKLEALYKRK